MEELCLYFNWQPLSIPHKAAFDTHHLNFSFEFSPQKPSCTKFNPLVFHDDFEVDVLAKRGTPPKFCKTAWFHTARFNANILSSHHPEISVPAYVKASFNICSCKPRTAPPTPSTPVFEVNIIKMPSPHPSLNPQISHLYQFPAYPCLHLPADPPLLPSFHVRSPPSPTFSTASNIPPPRQPTMPKTTL